MAVASGADLLIAEAYYFDKPVPYHLRHADIAAHRGELTQPPDRADPSLD